MKNIRKNVRKQTVRTTVPANHPMARQVANFKTNVFHAIETHITNQKEGFARFFQAPKRPTPPMEPVGERMRG